MPMATMTTISVPEGLATPEEARAYLADFVRWTRELMYNLVEDSRPGGELRSLFVPELIDHMPAALNELEEDDVFDRVIAALEVRDIEVIREHGLFGNQLLWKLANPRHWFEKFVETPTWKALLTLLESVDHLLESALDGVPGGGAIIEFKEAVMGAVERLAEA